MKRLAPTTLAGRLALGGIAWIGVWALGLLLAFNLLLGTVLGGQVDTALRARAEAVAETIHVRDGRLDIAEGDDAALDAGTSIYLGDELVEGGGLPNGLTSTLLQHGRATADRELLGHVRYLAQPITSGGQQVGTVVVSSDVGSASRVIRAVAVGSAFFAALMLLFTFFALRGTVARAMAPVRRMGEQAATWSDQALDRRFDPAAGPLELRQLAVTLNELLERISATLRHERDFTAELSHELRTPLAHLHAELDLLAHDPADPGPADLLTSVRRLEALVESALSPARLTHAPGLGPVRDVLADVRPPANARARLTVSGDTDLTLAVETDIARRALQPILENAWRYADHEVRIDVHAADGAAHLTVSDDGGRLAPEAAERIFTPGFRADPRDGHPGAGLGLALSRRIARAAGGDATAATDDGRTSITLSLPCLAR